MRKIKTDEELSNIINNYRDSMRETFGVESNVDQLMNNFGMLIAEKLDADFRSRFETLTLEQLLKCLAYLQRLKGVAHEDQPSGAETLEPHEPDAKSHIAQENIKPVRRKKSK